MIDVRWLKIKRMKKIGKNDKRRLWHQIVRFKPSVNMINLLNWLKKGRKKKTPFNRLDALRLLNKNYLTDEGVVIEKLRSRFG